VTFITLHRGDGIPVRINPARVNWYGDTGTNGRQTIVSFGGSDGISVVETPEEIDLMMRDQP
jgi:hypothetical protein